jgi:hypothetical protein
MTKVHLSKTYKARKPGVVLDIPQTEADSLVALGLGSIVVERAEDAPASKKADKAAAAE